MLDLTEPLEHGEPHARDRHGRPARADVSVERAYLAIACNSSRSVAVAELLVDAGGRLPEGRDVDLVDGHPRGLQAPLDLRQRVARAVGGDVPRLQRLLAQDRLLVGRQAVEPGGAGDEPGDQVDVPGLGQYLRHLEEL